MYKRASVGYFCTRLLGLALEVRIGKVVKPLLLVIQMAEGQPEENASYARKDSHNSVIPHQQRVRSEG